MNRERVISVFQYALAVAAREDDPFCRQLGPIHLLKYAYLVDLEYAKYNGGRTFTGIEWKFHSFGPWSNAAFELIAIAMSASSIQEHRIPCGYSDDDFFRWQMDTLTALSKDVGADLPVEVRGTLEKFVHKHGADTPSLLHYVYATPPILGAAPGETLDFSSVVQETSEKAEPFVPLMDRLSKRQKKAFVASMDELRARFESRHSKVETRRMGAPLDADFAETAEWVNSLAGAAFPSGEVTVDIDDAVWKSEARHGNALG